MAKLLLHSTLGDRQLDIPDGLSIRDALDVTDLRVRAACGGIGSCGACIVRVISGLVNANTLVEYQKLDAGQRAQGLRLACQLYLLGDAEILLEQAAHPSLWKSIPSEDLHSTTGSLPNLNKHIYGLAVDLGTTHIRVSLWNRKLGRRIATRKGPNPQSIDGADILNRLHAALKCRERTEELAKLARTAIIQAVRDILSRDVGEVSPMLARIGHVLIVGNTAMLALLSGHGSAELMDPVYWQQQIDCQPQNYVSWQKLWFMPNAKIELVAPIAGFVGSDLLADLLATHLTDAPASSLLLDIGTNSEIALWDGFSLYVTSVPGGPAFEGVGIRNGMSAESGAISMVTVTAEGFEYKTIDDDKPRGFCGSGFIDAVAILRNLGLIKVSGRFAIPVGSMGYVLDSRFPCTAITGKDIDALQRAKAAIAAGMDVLLKLKGMGWQDIQQLYICGAFGRYLNIAHAQTIGLLPEIAADKITLYADATLAGCEQALLDNESVSLLTELTKKTSVINLSFVPEYDDCFIKHLRLQPL